jgi:hypothetical protein
MQKELPIIKRVLGFWQRATEDCEICEALLLQRIRRFRAALEQNSYADAKRMLKEFESRELYV